MEIKAIKNYEGLYEVSEFGNVYSVEKMVTCGRNKTSVRKQEKKEKNFRFNKNGYKRVSLSKNGKLKTIPVHRIVAENFIEGNSKLTVNHKDGNKLNNHFSNLEFVSSSENVKHAYRTGLTKSMGVNSVLSKLNEKQVKQILKSDLTLQKLADKYNVHKSTIHRIKKGICYSNVNR